LTVKTKAVKSFETSPYNIASHPRRLETSGSNLILDSCMINENNHSSVSYFAHFVMQLVLFTAQKILKIYILMISVPFISNLFENCAVISTRISRLYPPLYIVIVVKLIVARWSLC
jgi:hypothetical protein